MLEYINNAIKDVITKCSTKEAILLLKHCLRCSKKLGVLVKRVQHAVHGYKKKSEKSLCFFGVKCFTRGLTCRLHGDVTTLIQQNKHVGSCNKNHLIFKLFAFVYHTCTALCNHQCQIRLYIDNSNKVFLIVKIKHDEETLTPYAKNTYEL